MITETTVPGGCWCHYRHFGSDDSRRVDGLHYRSRGCRALLRRLTSPTDAIQRVPWAREKLKEFLDQRCAALRW